MKKKIDVNVPEILFILFGNTVILPQSDYSS